MLMLLNEFGKTLFKLSVTTRDCAHWTRREHAGSAYTDFAAAQPSETPPAVTWNRKLASCSCILPGFAWHKRSSNCGDSVVPE